MTMENQQKMSIPIPNLHLDNFTLSISVPEDCPFVLTSPRSLQACEIVGVQPIDLLPSSLSDYCAAFPDLPKTEVVSIFREEETEREEKLAKCREVRRRIMQDLEEDGRNSTENISIGVTKMRKKSCLSPIVEQKGVREESPDVNRPAQFIQVQGLRRTSSLPTIYIEDCSSNDQPEVDQHIQEANMEMERMRIEENFMAAFEAVPNNSEGNESFESLGSALSFESELVLSDFTVSATPSPNMCGGRGCNCSGLSSRALESDDQSDGVKRCYSDSDVGSDRVGRCYSDLSGESDSCHPENPFSFKKEYETHLSVKTSRVGFHAKKKASRKKRLTSESLNNLNEESRKDPSIKGFKKPILADNCPPPESAKPQSNPWPHSKPVSAVTPARSNLLRTVLSRSDIDISTLKITKQDLRLLEILALRISADQKSKSKREQLRVQWEEERRNREKLKCISEKEYQRHLKNKRCREEEEAQRRLNIAREGFLKSQEYLRQLLKEKDDRKRKLIKAIHKQKEKLVKEHRVSEDEKHASVEKAVADLMARDTQYRKELKRQVEKKLDAAERKRKSKEKRKFVTIAESNRQEAQDHQQRMKKLEEIYSDHIEKVKKVIEMKFKKAEQIKQQEMFRWGNRREYGRRYSAVLSLKAELDAGLDLWRKQVLSVQSLSIMKAEERVRREMEERKEKLAEEMQRREDRFKVLRKESQEKSHSKRETHKERVEDKKKKTDRLLVEREVAVQKARSMAETSAQLRNMIRGQLMD